MALAGVLSAIKELVLDAPTLPDSLTDRQALYADRFSSLSKEEIEDLAKIDPEKLGIYTMTIFKGEKSGLNNHFKMTLGLLKRNWSKLNSTPYNEFELVKQLHKVRPWKSNKFRDLAENFKIFLLEDQPKYKENIPELSDVLSYETTVMDTRRFKNAGLEAKDSLQVKALSEMKVPDLLKLHYQVPSYNHFLQFSYDIISAGIYQKKEKTLIQTFNQGNQFAICSRNIELITRWTELPEVFWNTLKSNERSKNYELSELADLADEIMPDAKNEEELFANFFAYIAKLVERGAVIIT
ncbi:MAG: hypothetical protein R3A13_01690 [Bdellovibrionota bacterium]